FLECEVVLRLVCISESQLEWLAGAHADGSRLKLHSFADDRHLLRFIRRYGRARHVAGWTGAARHTGEHDHRKYAGEQEAWSAPQRSRCAHHAATHGHAPIPQTRAEAPRSATDPRPWASDQDHAIARLSPRGPRGTRRQTRIDIAGLPRRRSPAA